MTSSRRLRGAWLAGVLAVLAVLGGVVVSSAPHCPDTCPVVAAPRGMSALRPAVPKPAALSVTPPPASDHISPAGPVLVTATTGAISDVTMRNDAGKMIPGVLTPDNKAWKPTGPLGYGRTYTMTIAARGPGGMPSRQTSSFTTVTPELPDRGLPRHGRRRANAGRRNLRRRHRRRRALRRTRSTTRRTPNGTSSSPPPRPCRGRGTGSTTRPRIGGLRSTTPQALR